MARTVLPSTVALLLYVLSCTWAPGAGATGGRNAYIYGMHDYNDAIRHMMTYNGEARGWLLLMQSLSEYHGGTNQEVVSAANAGFGIVVRLHWGFGSTGTLSTVSQYDTFASRASLFIQNHINHCKFYHIGNEPDLCVEWPGGGLNDGCCQGTGNCQGNNCSDKREKITAARYVDCFQRVYNSCVARGIQGFFLCPAPTATWSGTFNCVNNGFDGFDFMCYAKTIYAQIPAHMIGGFALHPKTREHDPAQITSNAPWWGSTLFGCAMNESVRLYFRVYIDMLDAIPVAQRHKAVFFTELNPHFSGWGNVNNGYVVAAYNEIHNWNVNNPTRRITAMMLYRWDDGVDMWDLHDRPQVHQDFRNAIANGQTSNGLTVGTGTPPPTPTHTHTPTHTRTPTHTFVPTSTPTHTPQETPTSTHTPFQFRGLLEAR